MASAQIGPRPAIRHPIAFDPIPGAIVPKNWGFLDPPDSLFKMHSHCGCDPLARPQSNYLEPAEHLYVRRSCMPGH